MTSGIRPNGGLKSASDLAEVTDQILAESDWIADGIYHGWTDPLIDAADLVVWLDPAWPVAVWRVLIRHIKADLRRNNKFPGYWNLMKFLISTRKYYLANPEESVAGFDWSRSTTEPYIDRLGDRIVRRARLSAVEVLASLSAL